MEDEIQRPAVLDYGWEQSAEIGDIIDAFAKAQANFTDPVKDTKGQYGKHATMAGVYDSIRKHLNKEGIAVIVAKSAQHDLGTVGVSVRFYKGAQYIGVHASTPINAERQTYIWAQASGWTYLERYLTSGLAGVAPDDDDDGLGATSGTPEPEQVRKQHQQAKAQQQTASKKPSETPTTMEGNILTATVKEIRKFEKPGKNPGRQIMLADPIAIPGMPKPFDCVWVWHKNMFEDLEQMPDRECEFMVATGEKGLTLNTILRIGSIPWGEVEDQTQQAPEQQGGGQ